MSDQEKHIRLVIETGQVWLRDGERWHVPLQPEPDGAVTMFRMAKTEHGLWRWVYPRLPGVDEQQWTLVDFATAELLENPNG